MKVLGITGYKQSGKDTAANELKRLWLPKRTVQINFADALKQEVATACGVSVSFINAHKDNFRLILQGWGTNFRRQMHGDSYWTLKWVKSLIDLPTTPDYIICSDVRFLNEANVIKQAEGKLVRVVRPGFLSDGHASETEQDKIEADYTIVNDGTLEDLRNKLKQIKL